MGTLDPKFNSPQLQKAFELASPHLDSHLVNLDEISEDIKNLEKYLQQIGVRMEVRYTHVQDGPSYESLVWGEDPQSKRWRIMHEVAWDREALDAMMLYVSDTSTRVRPLIEMPVADRIAGARALPILLERITAAVALEERVQIPK